ncbi:hypothetical protein FBU59_003476 [Linderina macrospora]|uniref:Uncharacterized protein n=1 Tax=Linderina macrospora TaxID=4868 RepID=A0ACC1J8B8_9FUNG|nr:hypothetical protein FBU59_003476 [Linderina macrospora]
MVGTPQQAAQVAPMRPTQQVPTPRPAVRPNVSGAGGFQGLTNIQNLQQLQQLQLQLQMQAQAQGQASQNQQMMAAQQLVQQNQVRPHPVTAESVQQWMQVFETIVIPFTFRDQQINLSLYTARSLMGQLEAMHDAVGSAEVRQVCMRIISMAQQIVGRTMDSETLQAVPATVPAARTASNVSNVASSPAMPMATAPGAQPKRAAGTKGAKKRASQSPLTVARPAQKAATPPSGDVKPNVSAATGVTAATGAPVMARKESVSADSAISAVEEVRQRVRRQGVDRLQRRVLSEEAKTAVRESLPAIEQLVVPMLPSLPTLYMAMRNDQRIAHILTIEQLVAEQKRLLSEDVYMVTPEQLKEFRALLLQSIAIMKTWAGRQMETMKPHDAAPQTTAPLTNMHPGAVTTDPALEPFQRAVKRPLEPTNLKLPAAKKRGSTATGKSTVDTGAQPPVSSQEPQHVVPAGPVLPPGMTQEQFQRLPQELRVGILQQQQAALIRQSTTALAAAAAVGTAASSSSLPQPPPMPAPAAPVDGTGTGTGTHLWAALQGIGGAAQPDEDLERLKRLEQDKWNNPLEYLVGVLDRFTKGAERAGVEPAPILQQAFWPIARKSMASGWGVVAADAVL